jgi:hypothetical protein
VDAAAFSPHAPGSREYLAMESGTLLFTIDSVEYELSAGDSIYYTGDCVHAFKNPRNKLCIYYLAIDVSPNRGIFGSGRRASSFTGEVNSCAPLTQLTGPEHRTWMSKGLASWRIELWT